MWVCLSLSLSLLLCRRGAHEKKGKYIFSQRTKSAFVSALFPAPEPLNQNSACLRPFLRFCWPLRASALKILQFGFANSPLTSECSIIESHTLTMGPKLTKFQFTNQPTIAYLFRNYASLKFEGMSILDDHFFYQWCFKNKTCCCILTFWS